MKGSNKILFLALIFCVGFFESGVDAQRRARNEQSQFNSAVVREAERVSGDRFTIATTTPNGATVYAVRQPTRATLRAIDDGLSDLFAIARKNNYRSGLNYSDYTIFIARADRNKDSAGNYSPDIAVAANQYAGSVYDQGGYVYAAGMVIGYNPAAFMIAEHERNLQRITEVVRYEGEHIVLYHNDRRKYRQTADHSKGGGHPILN
ncbi:MAG: hypothetical protein M3209_04920 [Acidobacteriota bacterium]|nr:hypothetical protein [Acidobacteriota bacterium]